MSLFFKCFMKNPMLSCRVADMTWDSKSKCWIPTEEVWDSGGIPWDSDQRDSKVTARIPLGFWKTVGIPVGFRGITTKGIPK